MIAEKLRKAVLQAAIQGKLTEQLPEDGDARDLLKEIQLEKARLVKEGKLKKEKPLPPIKDDEIPFDIPDNWVWVRLGELIVLISGQDMESHFYHNTNSGVPYVTGASNFLNGQLIINRYTGKPKAIAYQGDLLLTCKGTVGEMAFLYEEKAHIARQVMAIRKISNVDLSYIQLFLSYYVDELNALAKSMIPGISRSSVLLAMIPLPPLVEQLRIIEKSGKIQLEVEKLEADESKLDALEKAFPQQLKNAILQAAIQGKLTEQLPEDGDARDLLKQIRQEKSSMVKAGKLKKEPPLPPITEDDPPFDIPNNWVWCRLGELIVLISGQDMQSHFYHTANSGIPYITGASNFSNGHLMINRYTGKPKSIAYQGDLLLTCKGTVGEMAFLNEEKAHIARQVMAIRKVDDVNLNYIQLFLNYYVDELNALAKSMIPGISRSSVLLAMIPLPPLIEQQRIVERLEELLPLCEKLE